MTTPGRHGGFVSHGRDHRGGDSQRHRFAAEAVQAVRHANRVAALSTEVLGTEPAMPTREQVAARLGA